MPSLSKAISSRLLLKTICIDNFEYPVGWMVRLDKIIQSYRIMLCYCDDPRFIHDKNIKEFKQQLADTYQKVYRRLYSDEYRFGELVIHSTGYSKFSIQMVFNSNLDEIAFDSDKIKREMKTRPLALKVYGDDEDSLKNSYLEIEKAVQQEFVLQGDSPQGNSSGGSSPLPPPPPSLVELSASPPAGLPRPVARRSPNLSPNSQDSRHQIVDKAKGIIYCQAIFDAMGLTTEFMGVNQAKIVMHMTRVANITATDDKQGYDLTVSQEQIQNFLRDPYGIRRQLNCRVDQQSSHRIHSHLQKFYNTVGSRGDRVRKEVDFWRQFVPKGCFTDDTDQAVLKFHALKDANGDITKAVKLYATYLKDWTKRKKEFFFGKHCFGLGGNTSQVIKEENFTEQPISASQKVWEKLATEGEKDSKGKLIMPRHCHFAQDNGALMSSSYVL
ncbi:MAG: ADP-ribosylglycohydrolase family protein, partial [Alphaproteobacteria bacterium]